MKILLIDDSQNSLNLIKTFLKNAGYKDIVCTRSAKEGFSVLGIEGFGKKFSGTEIDLILMDILMPEMDGIEACKIIKKNDTVSHIPIVMVTGVDETKKMEEAFDAGAVDYIRKPIEKIELLSRVRSIFRLKDAETLSRRYHAVDILNSVLGNFICDALLNRLSAISMSLWLCKKDKDDTAKYLGIASQETIDFLAGIKAFQKTKNLFCGLSKKVSLCQVLEPFCSQKSLEKYDGGSFLIPSEIKISMNYFDQKMENQDLDFFDVVGPESSIISAVREILINALESYPNDEYEKKEVVIDIKKNQDDVLLCIQDWGCGISSDELFKVQLPFYKILGSKKSSRLGLGAYIANAYIAQCGGSISYESIKGEGTKVFICLPSFDCS